MRILAVENSGEDGSVALVVDGHTERMETFSGPRGRGSGLFTALASIVRPGTDFDLVLVGTGPGGYNGLRASIAAAWGIARARNIRVAGVCSLLGFDAPDYFVLGDARAGEWFCAQVADGLLVGEPELLPPDVALERVGTTLPVFATSVLPGPAHAVTRCPRADVLASRQASAGPAEPVYLKPPHITKPRAPFPQCPAP